MHSLQAFFIYKVIYFVSNKNFQVIIVKKYKEFWIGYTNLEII